MDDDPRRSRPVRLTPVRIDMPDLRHPVMGDPDVRRIPGRLHRIHVTVPAQLTDQRSVSAPDAARTRRVEGTS
jgi:hypothetical protein